MYESLINNRFLNKNQLCLCRCPDWCEEGYQVAKWNGMKFEYEADPNGGFDRYVKAFIPLDADGRPCKLDKIHRYCPNCGASNTLTVCVALVADCGRISIQTVRWLMRETNLAERASPAINAT